MKKEEHFSSCRCTQLSFIHVIQAFSTPWFLLSSPSNHHLVFFLLEMLNNLIQYQVTITNHLLQTII